MCEKVRTEFVKFQSEEIIDSFRSGVVYMKNLQYFIDLELQANDTIIGDAYENAMLSEAYETPFGTPIKLEIKNGYSNSFVFCLYQAKVDNNGIVDFSNANDIKKFGNYGLWIKDMAEFKRRIKEAAANKNYSVVDGEVIYYDSLEEISSEMMKVWTETHVLAFGKRKKYEFQNEYRFVIDCSKEILPYVDHIVLEIGDIGDITQKFSTQKLMEGERLIIV